MSEARKHEHRGTPPGGWSLPMAYWQDEVARARERVRVIGRELPTHEVRPESVAALEELSLSFEELSVAEEELRAQNDELERAQRLLLAEHSRYRELFEHAPVPYLVTDPRGVIRTANRAAARLLRCRVDRLLGKPLVVFAHGATRRRLRTVMNVLSDAEHAVIIAASLTNRDGDVRRLEINAAASRDLHDEVAEIRWLLFDRTKRARREERRRRRAAELESLVAERTAELRREQALKDNLLATVSHEFRTALTAIGGYAELLQLGVHGALNEAQTSDVKRISQAYGHLTSVVEDLLSYANLSAGMLAIEPTEILLSDVLNGLADLVAPQATARRVAVGIEPVDSRLVVRADPERLRQVLLNLLANAVKFSAQGGNVRVRCGVDVEAITIEVADDGEGIPPDARDRIFEPFVRLRTRSGAAGTGLGLAISRDLMRAMGGDVVLADSTVQGSCFVIRLPRSTPLAQQSSTA